MTDITIPALPAGATPTTASVFESVEGAASVKYTLAQMKTQIVGPGNVNVTTAKTLTVLNSMTLSGIDGSTLNISTGGTLGSAAFTATNAYLPITGGSLTGDLGVRAATPQAPLHVTGNGGAGLGNATIVAEAPDDAKINLYVGVGYQWSQRIATTGAINSGQWVLRYESGSIDALVVNRGGLVGIGTNPTNQLDVKNDQNAYTIAQVANLNVGAAAGVILTAQTAVSRSSLLQLGSGYTTSGMYRQNGSMLYANGVGGLTFAIDVPAPMYFYSNGGEAMRLDSSSGGQLLIGTPTPDATRKLKVNTTSGNSIPFMIQNENAVPGTSVLQQDYFTISAPNDATAAFLQAQDISAIRIRLLSNGGLANFSANNTNISDAELKTDIQPYDDKELIALEKSFTEVNWGKWKYKDQTHTDWNHGYTAQGVEKAFALTAPELVDESTLGTGNGDPLKDTGERRKVVYEADLTHIGMALLSRSLKQLSQALKRIEALEAKLSKAGIS